MLPDGLCKIIELDISQGRDDNHGEGLLLNIFSCQLMLVKLVKLFTRQARKRKVRVAATLLSIEGEGGWSDTPSDILCESLLLIILSM